MSRSKLTIPFSQACKLKDAQKCKLIECQAHRIGLEEWESKAILDVCTSNGWTDKGLAVLYEYAGHMDSFKELVEKRANCMEDVIDFVLGLSQEHGLLNIVELQSSAQNAAMFTVKILHTLCFWRRLQGCPRPLYVEGRSGGQWSFPFLLRDESKRLSDAIFESMQYVNMFSVLSLEVLSLLMAPCMEYTSFVDLYRYQQKYTGGRTRNKKQTQEQLTDIYDPSSLLRADCPVRIVFEALREVVSIEDRIEGTWSALRTLPGSGGVDPCRLYPVLRLPYRTFRAPTEDLAWFQGAVPRYLELEALITAFGKTHLPAAAAEAASFQGPSGALGPMKGTYDPDGGDGVEDHISLREETQSSNAQPQGQYQQERVNVLVLGGPPSPMTRAPPGAAAGPGGFVRAPRPAMTVAASPGSPTPTTPKRPAGAGQRRRDPITPQHPTAVAGVATLPSPHRTLGPPVATAAVYDPLAQQQQQQVPVRTPSGLAVAALPNRGNNAEVEAPPFSRGNSNRVEAEEGYGDSPLASGRTGLGFPVDPNLRKRSVTVAVVEHPEGSGPLVKDISDLRRRVTHAGTMSAASSVPGIGSHHSTISEAEEAEEGTGHAKESSSKHHHHDPGAYIPAEPQPIVQPRSLTPTEQSIPAVAVHHDVQQPLAPSIAPTELPMDSKLNEEVRPHHLVGASTSPVVSPLDFTELGPAMSPAPQPTLTAAAATTPSPQHVPILKQQSSFGSDLGSAKRPSQMVRQASDGRTKTLSFDSDILDDGTSSGSARGSNTPVTPSERPRNGSYEIIYQESPEERMAQPQIMFQATPSPEFNRKRSQSTPLNLLRAPLTASAPTSSGSTSIPFSPAIHVSTSMDALFSPTAAESSSSSGVAGGGRSRPHAAETRLRSAPAYPARKTYRRDEHTPSPERQRKAHSASRNFSARQQRAREDGEPHFMETFGMLDTLSKPFTRGESLAESQILHIALRSMQIDDLTLPQLAARKISVWWRLVSPRKKLLRRMSRRDECKAIVLSMADNAVTMGITRQRRRRTLMRNGAAMKIQRCFRHWCNTILVEERRLEREERSANAWRSLGLIAGVVQVSVCLFRYIRYWQRKRRLKRMTKGGGGAGHVLQRIIERYIQLRTLRRKLEQQQQLYTKMKVTSMMSSNNARSSLYRERELAVVCIQKCYRAYLRHKRLLERQYFNIMGSKITYFFIRCIARKRVMTQKKQKKAATVIQTFFRGLHTRARILKIVKSGLLLNSLWRKHRSYVSLKSQLRRVDRPHTLVVHGIRNIAKKTINSDNMHFKVSVWWHPLLHIVSQNDFNTIVQTKQPQFIYTSDTFYLVDTAEPKGHRRMSIAHSLRKLSNMIVPIGRRQSAMLSPIAPSRPSVSKGVFRYSQVMAERSSSTTRSARDSVMSLYNAMTSRKGSNTALPPIAGSAGSRSAVNSMNTPASARGSMVVPMGASANTPGSGSQIGASAISGAGGVGGGRKESVEAVKPSALVSQQLDIIHSDDESSSSSDDEEDEERSPKGEAPRTVTRSFLAQRMGLPSPSSNRNAPSNSSSSGAPSPAAPAMSAFAAAARAAAAQAAEDQSATEGALGHPSAQSSGHPSGQSSKTSSDGCRTPPPPESESAPDAPVEGESGRRWRRLSNVVLNAPELLELGAEPGPNIASEKKLTPAEIDAAAAAKRKSHVSSLFLRSTLNFMSLGAQARNKASMATVAEPKMICHFEDVVIKIPGCHGNSVIKFEIFEGDRKYGNTLFYLSKEGEMMFWGGEYQRNVNLLQQRRAVQFNSHIINARNPTGGASADTANNAAAGGKRVGSVLSSNFINNEEPILDFRVIAGAPLRSKCSWGRVAVRGSGPLKRILKGRDFLSSFLFDKWHRLYFSLDEFGLHLFDNKFNISPLHVIPVSDFKEVSVDVGAPIKQSSADAAKNVAEDIHNVKLVTFSGDDLYMRFPDTGTRTAWQEALVNAIQHHKCSSNQLAAARRGWVAKAVDGDGALKGRGILASAVDAPSPEEAQKVVPATGRNPFGSFTEGSGASHLHRLLRLRTERALAPFVGGSPPPGEDRKRGLARAATAPANAQQRPPDVKVIINQRGSPNLALKKQPTNPHS